MDNRTIVRGLHGISRQSVLLGQIYGGFALVDPLGVWVERPYLVKGYIERATELKLAGNALNRLQNQIKDKETHKQNRVLGNFY